MTHSSIRIGGNQVLYFDPFEVREERHDADVVFVTHDHFDHYSPEDIKRVAKDDTVLILPESIKGQVQDVLGGSGSYKWMSPGDTIEEKGLVIQAVPAYNFKPFHPREKNYVGYMVTMDGVTYYVAGDTDVTPENQGIKCDVALVPVGGKYTMDHREAAQLVNTIAPKAAIPTHYGSVVGSPEDGKKFAELVDPKVQVIVQM